MRATTVLLYAAIIILSPQIGQADVVKLKSGGTISGSIDEITFRSGGKDTKHARKEIASVYISPSAEDGLMLTGGGNLKGEVISIVVKTAAGRISFNRMDVADATIKKDPIIEARQTILAMKRAKIAPDDAKGLFDLAKWAREKGLKDEAEALAAGAIQLDPASKLANEAHKFLGHVLYDGEWMNKAEMATREKIEQGELTPAEPVKAEPSEEAAEAAKLEATKAMKTPAAQNDALCKLFLDKVENARQRELKAVYATYKTHRDQLTTKIKKEEEYLKKKTSGTTAGYTSVHVRDAGGGLVRTPAAAREAALSREAIKKMTSQRRKLDVAKRRTVAEIAQMAGRRMSRVKAVSSSIAGQLNDWKNVTVEAMVASYEAAIK
ncbi:MAG: hypothetical protein ABIF82_04900 [Planctomycetota bacterium]